MSKSLLFLGACGRPTVRKRPDSAKPKMFGRVKSFSPQQRVGDVQYQKAEMLRQRNANRDLSLGGTAKYTEDSYSVMVNGVFPSRSEPPTKSASMLANRVRRPKRRGCNTDLIVVAAPVKRVAKSNSRSSAPYVSTERSVCFSLPPSSATLPPSEEAPSKKRPSSPTAVCSSPWRFNCVYSNILKDQDLSDNHTMPTTSKKRQSYISFFANLAQETDSATVGTDYPPPRRHRPWSRNTIPVPSYSASHRVRCGSTRAAREAHQVQRLCRSHNKAVRKTPSPVHEPVRGPECRALSALVPRSRTTESLITLVDVAKDEAEHRYNLLSSYLAGRSVSAPFLFRGTNAQLGDRAMLHSGCYPFDTNLLLYENNGEAPGSDIAEDIRVRPSLDSPLVESAEQAHRASISACERPSQLASQCRRSPVQRYSAVPLCNSVSVDLSSANASDSLDDQAVGREGPIRTQLSPHKLVGCSGLQGDTQMDMLNLCTSSHSVANFGLANASLRARVITSFDAEYSPSRNYHEASQVSLFNSRTFRAPSVESGLRHTRELNAYCQFFSNLVEDNRITGRGSLNLDDGILAEKASEEQALSMKNTRIGEYNTVLHSIRENNPLLAYRPATTAASHSPQQSSFRKAYIPRKGMKIKFDPDIERLQAQERQRLKEVESRQLTNKLLSLALIESAGMEARQASTLSGSFIAQENGNGLSVVARNARPRGLSATHADKRNSFPDLKHDSVLSRQDNSTQPVSATMHASYRDVARGCITGSAGSQREGQLLTSLAEPDDLQLDALECTRPAAEQLITVKTMNSRQAFSERPIYSSPVRCEPHSRSCTISTPTKNTPSNMLSGLLSVKPDSGLGASTRPGTHVLSNDSLFQRIGSELQGTDAQPTSRAKYGVSDPVDYFTAKYDHSPNTYFIRCALCGKLDHLLTGSRTGPDIGPYTCLSCKQAL